MQKSHDTPPAKTTDTMTGDDVMLWLKKNQNFLQLYPEAIDLLMPPKEQTGRRVADFQNYMIERLKADKAEAIETTREIVETARNNMNNHARIQRAVLQVLEAETFDDFIQTITMDFTSLLDVDITSLVVEANGREIPHISNNGIRIVPEGTIQHWMNGKHSLLQSDISGIEAIYGPGAALVQSQALIRIDISASTPPAILAFGSRDPTLFEPGQGVDQVSFLARVVERQFRSWLMLPV